MKVLYSPEFGAAFRGLPSEVQDKIKAVDRKLAAGDLSDFDTQGWLYFIDFDEEWTGAGSPRENNTVFYWMALTPPNLRTIIF